MGWIECGLPPSSVLGRSPSCNTPGHATGQLSQLYRLYLAVGVCPSRPVRGSEVEIDRANAEIPPPLDHLTGELAVRLLPKNSRKSATGIYLALLPMGQMAFETWRLLARINDAHRREQTSGGR